MARNLRENVPDRIHAARHLPRRSPRGKRSVPLTYFPEDGGEPVVYELYATRSIARRENAPKTIAEIKEEAYADPNPLPPFSLEAVFLLGWPFLILIALILILSRVFKKKSKRSRKRDVPKPKSRYFR